MSGKPNEEDLERMGGEEVEHKNSSCEEIFHKGTEIWWQLKLNGDINASKGLSFV